MTGECCRHATCASFKVCFGESNALESRSLGTAMLIREAHTNSGEEACSPVADVAGQPNFMRNSTTFIGFTLDQWSELPQLDGWSFLLSFQNLLTPLRAYMYMCVHIMYTAVHVHAHHGCREQGTVYHRHRAPPVLFRRLNVDFLLFRILIVVLLLLLTIRTVFTA